MGLLWSKFSGIVWKNKFKIPNLKKNGPMDERLSGEGILGFKKNLPWELTVLFVRLLSYSQFG